MCSQPRGAGAPAAAVSAAAPALRLLLLSALSALVGDDSDDISSLGDTLLGRVARNNDGGNAATMVNESTERRHAAVHVAAATAAS